MCNYHPNHRFPPSRCRPRRFVMLSGTVIGVNGSLAPGFSLEYTVDGQRFMTTTDALGNYEITVPRGSVVTIIPRPLLGVTVSPMGYDLGCVCNDESGLDFSLRVIGPMI